jgi:hypothetical protein
MVDKISMMGDSQLSENGENLFHCIFDDALSRYFMKKGWAINQFSDDTG